MALAYQATYRNKAGKILDHQFAETSREAARQLFERNPCAQSVQCCDAFCDNMSDGRLRGNGFNIHWISRRELDDGSIAQRPI